MKNIFNIKCLKTEIMLTFLILSYLLVKLLYYSNRDLIRIFPTYVFVTSHFFLYPLSDPVDLYFQYMLIAMFLDLLPTLPKKSFLNDMIILNICLLIYMYIPPICFWTIGKIMGN